MPKRTRCLETVNIPAECEDGCPKTKATMRCQKSYAHQDNHLVQETNGKTYALIWENKQQ